nr:hypothetical protein [uncultured Sphingomonas sp.]
MTKAKLSTTVHMPACQGHAAEAASSAYPDDKVRSRMHQPMAKLRGEI